MTLFVSAENQNLLYEMIHKTSDILIAFPQSSQIDDKNAWFRTFIEKFFNTLPQNITRDQLKNVNRQVLGNMVASLREIVIQKSSIQVSESNLPRYNTLKREHAPEYESREEQYKNLFEVSKPKIIDFSEKIDDEVITNMSELIEQQKQLRERELQEYAPLPVQYGENIRVNILEDVSKETIEPVVINEKRVTFDVPVTNLSKPIIGISETEFDNMKLKMENMNEKIESILTTMQKLLTVFSEKSNIENDDNVSKIKNVLSNKVEFHE